MNDPFYQNLIGKKFKTNGRGPLFYDCYGLVIECAKRLGYYLPPQQTPEGIELRLAMFESIASKYAVPISKPKSFCVVVFSGTGTGGLHVGIVLEDIRDFIHSGGIILSKKSVRVDRLNQWPWKSHIQGYFKLTRELDN